MTDVKSYLKDLLVKERDKIVSSVLSNRAVTSFTSKSMTRLDLNPIEKSVLESKIDTIDGKIKIAQKVLRDSDPDVLQDAGLTDLQVKIIEEGLASGKIPPEVANSVRQLVEDSTLKKRSGLLISEWVEEIMSGNRINLESISGNELSGSLPSELGGTSTSSSFEDKVMSYIPGGLDSPAGMIVSGIFQKNGYSTGNTTGNHVKNFMDVTADTVAGSEVDSSPIRFSRIGSGKEIGASQLLNSKKNDTSIMRISDNNENLNSSNFVVFIPSGDLPENFYFEDSRDFADILLTKTGSSYGIMKIRVVDPNPSSESKSLYMLVNPSEKNVKIEKSFSEYITRGGPDADYWGDKPIKIDFSGTSGGFYAPESSPTGSGYGVRNFLKTLSFKNIMALVSYYKNNGFVFSRQEGGKTIGSAGGGNVVKREREVSHVRNIEIIYRDVVYTGSFDSFSVSFSSSKINLFSYSFEFTAYRHKIL